VDHAEAGRRRYPALGYRLESTPGRIERASPLYGEHNRRVLSDLLGLSDEQIDQLEASGVIASAPRTAPSATIPKEKVL
jgi:crotonobetainyl-CoA:carnitine CoA-transferase CaiB-like acyl-CoA transferase